MYAREDVTLYSVDPLMRMVTFTIVAVDTKEISGCTFYSFTTIDAHHRINVLRWLRGDISWTEVVQASKLEN